MTTRRITIPALDEQDEGNVFDIPTGYKPEEAVEQEELQVKDPPKRGWLTIVLVLVLALVAAFVGRATASDQDAAIADLRANLGAVEAEYEQANAELNTATGQSEGLQAELLQVRAELADAIDPEVVAVLQQSEAALTEQLAAADVQIVLQTEKLEELQHQLDSAARVNEQLQLDVETANATVDAQAMRINELGVELDASTQLVPARAEAAFELLAGVSFVNAVYDLGVVEHKIVRPGLWDDETQYFFGSGEVGFLSELEQARFVLVEDSLIQAVIPLPRIQPEGSVQLNGYTDTEREQFARIGGRWGDQTQMEVLDIARAQARELACSDAKSLRLEMNRLKQLATQLSRGYQLEVHWQDANGVLRTNITDAQLTANAC